MKYASPEDYAYCMRGMRNFPPLFVRNSVQENFSNSIIGSKILQVLQQEH
jgi:hypothetical protein